MSKRQRKTTQAVIEKRIKEGRGTGHFSDYKPWLTIHDVPSQGVVTRILGWKSDRLHHYFSEYFELAHHYQLEWALGCCDIREQYPLLPLEKTLFIADKLGVKHPVDPKTKHPIVMTTDMLLTVQTEDDVRFVAHTIKPKSKLNKRVLEKFEIEKVFFKDASIEWALITEHQINYELVKNVEWLHSAKNLEGNQISKQLIKDLEPILYEAIHSQDRPLAKTTLQFDESEGLNPGTCMFVVRHLIANRLWEVDMNKRIVPTLQPLKVYKNSVNGGNGYGVIQ
ncbi:TnsA endonuclease C-terminal domain-containing protein [Paenibacillus thalictri]|uniref:Heteromeric transposase endonuclease subunit TnsA n=1 Tax=Paenibacillus thalictri TaxID=2527873 RepID=A0A4Q9DGL8_9BACL|nr:TnsA endonuclease C-terminal domain-containing protein [Paenibacillus thalictri]TBL68367.1 heteromeric transposase endonuclease subunit TnsA [Paenibacillus thalictri]